MAKKKNDPQPARVWRARVRAWITDNWLTVYIIAIAASSSFQHFAKLAEKNGQTGYEIVTSSLIFDAVAIFFQQEIQKDKRDKVAGWRRYPPIIGMLAALAFTVAANDQTAHPGFWGVTFAIAPPVILMIIIAFRERRVSALARLRVADALAAGSQNQSVPVPEPGQNHGQNRAGSSPQNRADAPGNRNHADGGGGNPALPEPPEAGNPWLPPKIDRHAPQDVEMLHARIRQAMADFEARNGKPINAYWLGKVLECSKADALVLRRQAAAGTEQGKAAV